VEWNSGTGTQDTGAMGECSAENDGGCNEDASSGVHVRHDIIWFLIIESYCVEYLLFMLALTSMPRRQQFSLESWILGYAVGRARYTGGYLYRIPSRKYIHTTSFLLMQIICSLQLHVLFFH